MVNSEIFSSQIVRKAYGIVFILMFIAGIAVWIWFCDSLAPKIGTFLAIVLALIWLEIPIAILAFFYMLYLIAKYFYAVEEKMKDID